MKACIVQNFYLLIPIINECLFKRYCMSQLAFENAELSGACTTRHFCLPVQLPMGGEA